MTDLKNVVATTYLAPNGLPLICQNPNPETDIVTAVNCVKWYQLFLLKKDGTVEAINPGDIEAAMNLHPKSIYVDHDMHPKLLQSVAYILGAEVDIITLEVAAGRWALTQMDIDGMEYYDDAYYTDRQ